MFSKISNDQKEKMVHAVSNAIMYEIPEIMIEHNLPSSNGNGLFRYNIINRDLLNIFGENIEATIKSRGPWKLVLVHNSDTGATFSIMSKKNLERLQKQLPANPHYLEAVLNNNTGLTPIAHQMSLFNMPERDRDILDSIRAQLFDDFSTNLTYHLLVVFDSVNNVVTSIKAILLTDKLELVSEEDWSQYLRESTSVKDIPYTSNADESKEEIPISLK